MQHLCVVPTYFFLAQFDLAHWLGYASLLMAIIFNISHLTYLRTAIVTPQSNGEGRPRIRWGRSIVDAVQSGCIGLGMFATYTLGLIEGLCGAKVHRDRTQKLERDPASQIGGSSPGRSVLLIIAFEAALSVYSWAMTIWALMIQEFGLVFLYGVFCVAYPWSLARSLIEVGRPSRWATGR